MTLYIKYNYYNNIKYLLQKSAYNMGRQFHKERQEETISQTHMSICTR